MVSTFLITGVGTWVTAKIVEPRLGTYDATNADPSVHDDHAHVAGLEVGLRLASVNGDSVREMLFTHAVEMVRQARRPVTLELEVVDAREPPY